MGKYRLVLAGALALAACGGGGDARPDGGALRIAPVTLSGNWHSSCAIREVGEPRAWGRQEHGRLQRFDAGAPGLDDSEFSIEHGIADGQLGARLATSGKSGVSHADPPRSTSPTRQPSCLSSCIHSSPAGGRATSVASCG
jgi:hypothetical protein